MKTKSIAMLPRKFIALASAAILGLGSIAKANISIVFSYNALTGTTATYSGNWNVGSNGNQWQFQNYMDATSFVSTNENLQTGFGFLDVTPTLPWTMSTSATGHSGDTFGFQSGRIYGPASFSPFTPINGQATFAGKTFADLGFSPSAISAGSGSFSLGVPGTINWSITPAAIPEPSSYAALLGSMGLGFALMRRRRVNP
jgi:hypothetical protein